MRLPRLLLVTVPACLLAAWAAARAVGGVQARNAEAVVATFEARGEQQVRLPAAGTYWVFGAGSRDAMKAASSWPVVVWNDSTREQGTVTTATSRRSRDRENRAGLDLLFTIQVPSPGPHTLRLTADGAEPGAIQLRITRFSPSTAGAAMQAFGLAALFSVLLVLNAVIWFRRAPG
jgi:hypothetical protein